MGWAYNMYGVEYKLYWGFVGAACRKKNLEKSDENRKIVMKCTLKNMVTRCGLDSSGRGYRQAVVTSQGDNEPSVSIK
jgi:hypothetical protein